MICQYCQRDLPCVTVDSFQQLTPQQLETLPTELATIYAAYCYRCLRDALDVIDMEMLEILEEQCQLCGICHKR